MKIDIAAVAILAVTAGAVFFVLTRKAKPVVPAITERQAAADLAAKRQAAYLGAYDLA
jgi:anti-sigma-K factor RskA